MQRSEPLHIALALHDAHGHYWPYVAVTVTSVLHHSSVPVVVHVLHDATLGDEARLVLSRIVATYGHQLHLHAVEVPHAFTQMNFRHFSVACAYRLLLPRLLPHLQWVLYLDADLVFHQFDVALIDQWIREHAGQMPLAAVHDDLFDAYPEGVAELEMLKLGAEHYFNSGVLALQPALIQEDLVAELSAFASRHPHALHLDQDLLNHLFRGRWARMPAQFNTQVNLSFGRCFAALPSLQGKVLHYSGKVKPLAGKFSPADICFWRYTQHIADIARFVGQPLSYLQKIHTGHSHARILPVMAAK